MDVDRQSVINFFTSLPEDAIPLNFVGKYTAGNQPLFVCPRTGIISSQRIMSAQDIVAYWSSTLFSSASPDHYSAINPFAQARLLYTLLTLANFLSTRPDVPVEPQLCDFATGQGVLLDLARKHLPTWKLSATEYSKDLAEAASLRGYEVVNEGLGLSKHSLADALGVRPHVGLLSWTLCNCIDPLSVLKQIYATMSDGGYLCVAEGSRIMVPYRKSLADMFSPLHPIDSHPFQFSRRSLDALLSVSGFKPVYANRYFDSDVLVVIAQKQPYSEREERLIMDDPQNVVEFMKKWAETSKYFENDLRNWDRAPS
jgi:hypothetical protein